MASDTRNPLDVLLEDDDDIELQNLEWKMKSKKKFSPNWELHLPGGKIFPISNKETAIIILLMQELSKDFANRNIKLFRQKYGQMFECEWKKLAFKPKDKGAIKTQAELLIDLVKGKIKEEEDK